MLLTFSAAAALQGQSRESVLKAVAQTSKWSPADKPIQYDEKNLDVLAGKRAPAIRSYGFTGATVLTWNGEGGSVHATLYEMIDSGAAYGLYTLERNVNQAGFTMLSIGTEGFRAGNQSVFWQSKYVVKLDGSASSADALGRLISQSIFGRSQKPAVSNHLPPENLAQGTEQYIVDETGIGRELSLDPKRLGFDDSVEIATATYRVGGKSARLVLLMYPTQQVAKRYEEGWVAESPEAGGFRKRVGPLLALVRGTSDSGVAKSILDGVNHEFQVTWDQPRPDISIRQVILTIFTFIGIALLFTIVVGLSFGGFRIFVKARYPNRVFDRPEDMEIIQLKLAQGVMPKHLGE